MLIIIDKKITPEAKETLSAYGDLMELETSGITYAAISGHPDIFFMHAPGHLIVAPNLPPKYFEGLKKIGIEYVSGEFHVGAEYPASARYNAVAADQWLIHNFRHTDFIITRTLEDFQPVHVDQGYCRCNLLPLKGGHFITSDVGIYKVLLRGHFDVLYVSPTGIILEGFPNGFFGGCCGIVEDKVFINGSLEHFPQGEKVRRYLQELDYVVVELYDGPLVDVGSILFIKS